MRPTIPETEAAPYTIAVIDRIVAQGAILTEAWRNNSKKHPAVPVKAEYAAFVAAELEGRRIRFTGSYETIEVKQTESGVARTLVYRPVEGQDATIQKTVVADGNDPEMILTLTDKPEEFASINLFRTQVLEIFSEAEAVEAA